MHLRSLLAVTAGAALLLTGCGGSDKDDAAATKPATSVAATSESPSASPSPTTPAVADLAAKAKTAFDSAPYARVVGSVVDSGMTIKLDVVTDLKGNGSGSVSMGKGTAKIVLLGTNVYISGDKAFWTENGGAEAARMLVGKWVQTSAKGKDFAELSEFLNRKAILDEDLDGLTTGDVAESADGKTWQVTVDGGTLGLDKATGRPVSLKGTDEGSVVNMLFSYPTAGAIQAPPKNKILKIG